MILYEGRKSPLIMAKPLIKAVVRAIVFPSAFVIAFLIVGVPYSQVFGPPEGGMPGMNFNDQEQTFSTLRQAFLWIGPLRILIGNLAIIAAWAVLSLFRALLDWLRHKYTLSDRSIIYGNGLFDYESTTISLASIEKIQFKYGGILNRILGIGKIFVLTRDNNVVDIGPIHGAFEVTRRIQQLI
jgi:uncharacterized membrane protein YdbT with pleckstrin-like domain